MREKSHRYEQNLLAKNKPKRRNDTTTYPPLFCCSRHWVVSFCGSASARVTVNLWKVSHDNHRQYRINADRDQRYRPDDRHRRHGRVRGRAGRRGHDQQRFHGAQSRHDFRRCARRGAGRGRHQSVQSGTDVGRGRHAGRSHVGQRRQPVRRDADGRRLHRHRDRRGRNLASTAGEGEPLIDNSRQLEDESLRHLWPPFTQLSGLKPTIMERAEGAVVYDTEGNAYIDAFASLWTVNVGHGRKEIFEPSRPRPEARHLPHLPDRQRALDPPGRQGRRAPAGRSGPCVSHAGRRRGGDRVKWPASTGATRARAPSSW